ncbi:hypothetical protein [Gracilimonas sp.]|uniref:hypothetical protein n=1 Tax=Gracilimonas sp. TaxID=1974203 RepID=UPI003D116CE1
MTLLFKHNPHLGRLDKYLNFKMGDSTPGPMYLFPDSLASAGLAVAVLATPIVLWSLFRLKRYGWLAAILIVTILPTAFIYMVMPTGYLANILFLIPLFFLAICYVILKQKINDWREPIFINKPGSDYNSQELSSE